MLFCIDIKQICFFELIVLLNMKKRSFPIRVNFCIVFYEALSFYYVQFNFEFENIFKHSNKQFEDVVQERNNA